MQEKLHYSQPILYIFINIRRRVSEYNTIMSQIAQLITTIKQCLKAAGLTYRDVAVALDISEPSVKRLFSSGRLTVDRLAQFSDLLGLTLAELLQKAESSTPRLQMLTLDQETQLVSNERLLLVAVCVLNNWTIGNIISAYQLSKPECIKHLLVLQKMGLADLKPENRIRLLVARDFDWLPNGPIRAFFLRHGLPDFMTSRFDTPEETLDFTHGMLTRGAYMQLQAEMHKLRGKLAVLHKESLAAPLSEKQGTALLIAMRAWEPQIFRELKRI